MPAFSLMRQFETPPDHNTNEDFFFQFQSTSWFLDHTCGSVLIDKNLTGFRDLGSCRKLGALEVKWGHNLPPMIHTVSLPCPPSWFGHHCLLKKNHFDYDFAVRKVIISLCFDKFWCIMRRFSFNTHSLVAPVRQNFLLLKLLASEEK